MMTLSGCDSTSALAETIRLGKPISVASSTPMIETPSRSPSPERTEAAARKCGTAHSTPGTLRTLSSAVEGMGWLTSVVRLTSSITHTSALGTL